VIFDSVAHVGASLLALAELRLLDGRGDIDLEGAPAAAWAQSERFWRAVLGLWGTDHAAAGVWSVFAAGATSLALVDADPAFRFAWLAEASNRLADRLARRAPRAVEFVPGRQPEAPGDRERSGARSRLIDAAIQLIGEHGVEALTHRRIAAVAGLSLASTTYFFTSKSEIIFEAFRELHRRTVQDAASDDDPVFRPLADVLFTQSGAVRWEIGAMHALYLAAARDSTLRSFALGLRQVRGRGALRRLVARGHAQADVLDGFVWSLMIGGLFLAALPIPPHLRSDFVRTTANRMARAIFGDLVDEKEN
jgi:DNA-binding transcriptional regulator YbjK